jgi:hypothetical protein
VLLFIWDMCIFTLFLSFKFVHPKNSPFIYFATHICWSRYHVYFHRSVWTGLQSCTISRKDFLICWSMTCTVRICFIMFISDLYFSHEVYLLTWQLASILNCWKTNNILSNINMEKRVFQVIPK